jgi:hypothetical protein
MRALFKGTKRLFYVYLALFMFTAFAPSLSQAAMLDLTLKDSPDIFTQFITFNYQSSGRTFSAGSSTMEYFYSPDADGLFIDNGLFALTGSIDSADRVTGNLSILGNIPGASGSGTLLTAQLTGFGYGSTDGVLEFLFKANGGDLASLYGSEGGIILSHVGFQDLDRSLSPVVGSGSADVGSPTGDDPEPVPEPGTAALFLCGCIGMVMLRRHRNAHP